jgi:hypothetical protein
MRLMGTRRFLHGREYNRRLLPLKEFYCGDDMGYIVIIPRHVYQRNKENKIIKYFRHQGGLIQPFYAGRLEFREEVRGIITKYGLKLKEEKIKTA